MTEKLKYLWVDWRLSFKNPQAKALIKCNDISMSPAKQIKILLLRTQTYFVQPYYQLLTLLLNWKKVAFDVKKETKTERQKKMGKLAVTASHPGMGKREGWKSEKTSWGVMIWQSNRTSASSSACWRKIPTEVVALKTRSPPGGEARWWGGGTGGCGALTIIETLLQASTNSKQVITWLVNHVMDPSLALLHTETPPFGFRHQMALRDKFGKVLRQLDMPARYWKILLILQKLC